MTQNQSIKLRFREALKRAFDRYLPLLGHEVLEPDAMTARYPQLCLPCADAVEPPVPQALPIDGFAAPELAADGPRHYGATFVYRIPRGMFRRLEILASGGLLIDRKVIPNTGLGNQRASIITSVQPSLRKSRREEVIIAPWPHFMQITYGDWLMYVMPRLCRILGRMTDEEKSRAVIAYPLAKTSWETDYLGKLGFPPGQIVDTRVWKIEPSPQGMIHAASGEDTGWFQRSAHPADYQAMRHFLWKGPELGRAPSRKLYLQRKARRRILNETELLGVLQPHSFEVMDPGERSIAEQMALYADASIILGAHGANLNNMVWCTPSATVIELFGRGYRLSHNHQLAFNLSLNYHYWAERPMEPHQFSHLNWDITVDVDAVKKFLAAMG